MTSGLVVTLDPDAEACDQILDFLAAAPVFTVGERTENWLSVAMETEVSEASEWWTDWLNQLPGVSGVEVVFVYWDQPASEVIHDGT